MSFYHSKYGVTKKKKKSYWKFLVLIIVIIMMAAAAGGYLLYQVIYKPNVWTPDKKNVSIYIPS